MIGNGLDVVSLCISDGTRLWSGSALSLAVARGRYSKDKYPHVLRPELSETHLGHHGGLDRRTADGGLLGEQVEAWKDSLSINRGCSVLPGCCGIAQ